MLSNLDFLDVVEAPNGPFVFCRPCTTIVAANPHPTGQDYPLSSVKSLLYRHLHKYHAAPKASSLPPLIAARPRLAEALHNSRHQMPLPLTDYSLPFPGLKIWDRLECKACSGPNPSRFSCEDSMRKHLRAQHGKGEFRARFRIVPMQTWFPNHYGGMGIWWFVQVSKRERRMQLQTPPPSNQTQPIPDLHTERHLVGTQLKDDKNLYLEQTGWLETFRDRPYWRALRQATYIPQRSKPLQLTDESDTNSELFDAYFSTESEAILGVIVTQQQQLFRRCEATFHTTPYYLRQWVRSNSSDQPYRDAFTWLRNKGYLGYWKRLLCLIFRAYQLSPTLESRILGVYTWLTDSQQTLIRRLWELAHILYLKQIGSRLFDPSDPVLDYLSSINSSLEQELEERLMELNLSLLTRPLDTWSASSQHLLVYYIGVLSLDLTTGSATHYGFVPISQSTTYLSSFIWVSRLLYLEYALPQKPYRCQGWPSREVYNNALERFQSIHSKYLAPDRNTVFRELLRLRALGRKLRNQDIGRCLLYWSKQNTVVRVGKQSLKMADFRD